MSDEPKDDPPSVAPPMASLLRKARSRKRDVPYAEEGNSPQAYREDIRVSLEQEQFEAPSFASRDGVGALLRQCREQRGQDLESVARALRIRHPYLVAIEEGRYRDLPGAPYASGFVRSYAEYLGLDAVELLRRFREESGNMGARSELVFPTPVSEGGFPAAILIGVVIILAAVVYGVWYFYQWRHGSTAESVSVLPDRLAALIHAPGGEDQPDSSSAQAAHPTPAQQQTKPAPAADMSPAQPPALTPVPTPPKTSTDTAAPAVGQTATATPAPSPAPPAPAPAQPAAATTPPAPAAANTVAATNATPAPVVPAAASAPAAPQPQTEVAKLEPDSAPPPPTAAPSSTVSAPPAPDLASPSHVVLRATEDCWIEIRDPSGAIVASRLMHKGDAFPVPPRPGLTLTVGNAGALTVLLDGNPMPPLGKTGMVRHDVPLDPERGTAPAPAAAANPAPAPANSDSPNN